MLSLLQGCLFCRDKCTGRMPAYPAERLAHRQVTFLGTGAAIPAKYRNVTGIYVHMFARGGLMLDCGMILTLEEAYTCTLTLEMRHR